MRSLIVPPTLPQRTAAKGHFYGGNERLAKGLASKASSPQCRQRICSHRCLPARFRFRGPLTLSAQSPPLLCARRPCVIVCSLTPFGLSAYSDGITGLDLVFEGHVLANLASRHALRSFLHIVSPAKDNHLIISPSLLPNTNCKGIAPSVGRRNSTRVDEGRAEIFSR